MASDRMPSPASSEFYKSKNNTSHELEKSVINYGATNNEIKRGLPVTALEKREVHSYRNLPGLFETASSAECVVRNTVNREIHNDSLRNVSSELEDESVNYTLKCQKVAANERVQSVNVSDMAKATSNAREGGSVSKSAMILATNGEITGLSSILF